MNLWKKIKCGHHKNPAAGVILRVVNKFYETGSVHDNRALVGAKWNARTQERQEEECRLLAESPRTSITRQSQQLEVSWLTTYRIVWEDIGLFPYKEHAAQRLTPYSKERWLNFTQDFTADLALKPNMLNNIWFTDEYHFWMNGHINKQNMRLWPESKPCKTEVPLHPTKITLQFSWNYWSGFHQRNGNIGVVPFPLADNVIPEMKNQGLLKSTIFQ